MYLGGFWPQQNPTDSETVASDNGLSQETDNFLNTFV